jgi:hypothetical protein
MSSQAVTPSDTWMKARPLNVVAARACFGRDGKGTQWIEPGP